MIKNIMIKQGTRFAKDLYPNFGMRNKHHSKIAKENISNGGLGLKHSGGHHISEARKKMFKDGIANFNGEKNPFYGHHHTKKFKEWIRNKNKKTHNEDIKIRQKIKDARAKQIFPIKDTSIEVKIQKFLSQLQIEYFTYHWINNIEYRYQCDIFIPSKNLIIECFGDYWHNIPYGSKVDILRCQELRVKGYRVLVFWEREIRAMELDDFKNKLETIN